MLGVIVLIVLIAGIAIALYSGYKFYPTYQEMSIEADKIVEQIDERTFVRLDPTVIVRKDGNFVREFKPAPYKYIEINDMPKKVKEVFIAIEDKNFYEHKGFDIKANLRAFKALIDNRGKITQGGSTITQQLIKNTFLTHEQTYKRKVKEILIAIRLENKLSKDKILEYYINNIYYGHGAHGIETAAEYYFSDSVNNLTLSEIAFLAAIPNNPTIYDPVTNIENTLARRDKILTHMLEEEFISENECLEAKNQLIELNIKPKDEYIPEDYEVSYIMSSATKTIMEYEGFNLRFDFKNDEDRAEYNKAFQEKFDDVHSRLRTGGYKIVSTIDPVKQQQLQDSINNGLSSFSSIEEESGMYKTQGAGVTIDNKTNELVAIVGGRTQEGVANTFNRAFLAYRQPGSVTKPIIVYSAEIEDGMIGSTKVHDIKDSDGPHNSGGKYRGEMSAREALQRSVNTVPFELMKQRGTYIAREYMKQLEFSNLVDKDKYPGISIGAFTYGTTPLQINGSFATLANNGNYVRPTGIDKIYFDGELIYENNSQGNKVYNESTAYLLTDMLKGVLTERWGTGYGLSLESRMPAAAKSGTTDDNKDGWFAGYTPYYTTTIWVGNDQPSQIKGLFGGTYPGRIWKNYMDKIHEGLTIEDFEMPASTKMMYVNTKTGDVSEVQKPGYTSYEVVPLAYISSVHKAREHEKMLAEERAKEKEMAELIRKEEFKNRYGISEEEEFENRNTVANKISQAINVKINNEQDYQIAINLLNEANSLLSNVKVDDYKNKYEAEINEGYSVIEDRWNKIIEELNKPEVQPSEPETTEPIIQPSEPETTGPVIQPSEPETTGPVIQPESEEVEEIQPSEPEESPKQEEEDEDVDEINS